LVKKIDKKIDSVSSKIDTNSFVLGVLILVNSVVMVYFKEKDYDIKRLDLKVKMEEVELKKKSKWSW